MDLRSELTRCIERREEFHVRLDRRPLQTCERDGRWMDICPISIDAELGRSPVLYRKRAPGVSTRWIAASLDEAIGEGLRVIGAYHD